ncbi:nicotianamine synthase family protein [Phytoactinopolyspora limicola]|uniref:nicotianamine synthase family protein n=1 Tax=Phytoactinopolyspora limicola TaxID=2715536 RepID=UPI00140934A4|nr:nicotianamine synthase family protein [Phytoactinopolyspora limicola]
MTVLDTVVSPNVAGDVTTSLCELYRQLDAMPDLRPGPQVNALFSDLVRLVIAAPEGAASQVLADPIVRGIAPRLRELCGRGEYELELLWARQIAGSTQPDAALARFPYIDNYRALGRMEMDTVAAVAERPIRRVAFLGSGPLPLSSVLLAQGFRAEVHNIDHDSRAVAVARQVSARLRLDHLTFHLGEAGDVDLEGYDLVVMAALVGSTVEEKAALLDHIATAMAPGALLLVRSARGLRTLLYPEVSPHALSGFDVVRAVHPSGEVINSAIVGRAIERSPGRPALPGARRGSDG